MKAALLVIDMQKKFRARGGACADSMDSAAKYIRWAIDLFAAKKLPVIHIVHNGENDPKAPEAEDFWEMDSIAAADRKGVIIKTKGSAFAGTSLQERLKADGVTMLVLCGFAAENCVLSTSRAAEDAGWDAVILSGALASSDPQNIPFVERISETVSAGALAAFLN